MVDSGAGGEYKAEIREEAEDVGGEGVVGAAEKGEDGGRVVVMQEVL